MEVTSTRVRLRHLRMCEVCHPAARKWFARHGFSWIDFLNNGIEGQKFLDTGDPMAIKVLRAAEKEEADGR